METFRPQRSPGSDRFLGLFTDSSSLPPPTHNGAAAAFATGDELHEDDDFFWTDSSEPAIDPPRPVSPPMASPNPSPSPFLTKSGFRRIPDRHFGVLAALPEDDKKHALPFLQRKSSISSASSTSTSPSPSSAARTISAIPKLKPAEYSLSVPAGKVYHQSAPVNVPVAPPKPRKVGDLEFDNAGVDDDGDEDEMLPPHEIVARASAKDSPMTTFSVLEGVGRTLKGRDLRRVRNAVWRKTGFLD